MHEQAAPGAFEFVVGRERRGDFAGGHVVALNPLSSTLVSWYSSPVLVGFVTRQDTRKRRIIPYLSVYVLYPRKIAATTPYGLFLVKKRNCAPIAA